MAVSGARWKHVKFPLPPGTRVGVAAHMAYLPPDSGARYIELPHSVVFAWAGRGKALALVVEFFGDEVTQYRLRGWPLYYATELLHMWRPDYEACRKWCKEAKKITGGRWDGQAADRILEGLQ